MAGRRYASAARFARRCKRAEETGPTQFDSETPRPGDVGPILDLFGRIESLGWKGRTGTSLLHDTGQYAFYFSFLSSMADRSAFRMMQLRVGAEVAAMMLGVVRSERLWILKTTFDPAYRRCSPGIILMHETIRHAFKQRLHALEFLGNDEPWLHIWTERVHPYVTYRTYPATLSGGLAFGADAGMEAARWLANRPERRRR